MAYMKFGTKHFYVHHLQKEWCSYKYMMKLCADISQVDDKVYYYLVQERCDPGGGQVECGGARPKGCTPVCRHDSI